MEFRSIHTFKPIETPIEYHHKLVSVGSCFAANMGNLLEKHFFSILNNPNGIIFNPISLAQGLSYALNPHLFDAEKYIAEHNHLFYSWLHHGSIYANTKEALLQKIQDKNKLISTYLLEADYLIITWGSAFVYELKEEGEIVANCHKFPGSYFHKRLLSCSEIVNFYQPFLSELLALNPKLKLIWSISPVKYLRDGLHENNLSKSTLFLALEDLLKKFPSSYYFPAFEILQDELRDYRFYAADMAHPSEQAILYIWEQFRKHVFSPQTQEIFKQTHSIASAMEHRILHPNTPEHERFKSKQLEQINALQKRYPELNLGSALSHFS